MPLPTTILAGELVTRATPTARAVWEAVLAGDAVLYFRDPEGTWDYRFDALRPYDPPHSLLYVLRFLGQDVAACKANDVITVERVE